MTSYPIDPELLSFAGINAPLGKLSALASEPLLGALPTFIDRSRVTHERREVAAPDGRAIPLHVIAPVGAEDEVLPCLYYIHGGAFLHKAIPTHYRLMQEYATRVRLRVVAVDYGLVPRHVYPEPVTDCLLGLAYVYEHATELRIDPTRVVMGGDSAGGSLTLDTWLEAAKAARAAKGDRGVALVPHGFMLVYPVVDHRGLTASMQRFTDTPIWNGLKNERMWTWYLEGPGGGAYRSPLQRSEEFSGLTCAFVEIEEFDCLHDEGAQMANVLEAAGVAVSLRDNPATYHGFDFHEHAAITKESVAARVAWLEKALV